MLQENPALRLKMAHSAPGNLANRVQSILSRDQRIHRLEAERVEVRVAIRQGWRIGYDEVEALRAHGLKPVALKQFNVQAELFGVPACHQHRRGATAHRRYPGVGAVLLER